MPKHAKIAALIISTLTLAAGAAAAQTYEEIEQLDYYARQSWDRDATGGVEPAQTYIDDDRSGVRHDHHPRCRHNRSWRSDVDDYGYSQTGSYYGQY